MSVSSSECSTTVSLAELRERSNLLHEQLATSSSSSRPPERLSKRRPSSSMSDASSVASSGVENCLSNQSDITGINDIPSEHYQSQDEIPAPTNTTISDFTGISSIVPDLSCLLSIHSNDEKTLELIAYLLRLTLHLAPSGLSALVSCAYAMAHDRVENLSQLDHHQRTENATEQTTEEEVEEETQDKSTSAPTTKRRKSIVSGQCNCTSDHEEQCEFHRNPLEILGPTVQMHEGDCSKNLS
ncbi:hypothetical protein GEMRC1_002589 [Eukaryota sp. GEM-RC1]